MDVFDRIISICKKRKIKKIELAKGVDISYSTLTSMFRRHPKNINYGIISRIAEYLDVETDYLFYGDSNYTEKANEVFLSSMEGNSNLDLLNQYYDDNFKFEQRTIVSTKITLEHLYRNNTTSSYSINIYGHQHFDPIWEIEALLLSFGIQDNIFEIKKFENEIDNYKHLIASFSPPFTNDKSNKISEYKSIIQHNEKCIKELKDKIAFMERKLSGIKQNKYLPM